VTTTDHDDTPARPESAGPSGLGGRSPLTLPFLVLAWISGLLALVMMVTTTVDVGGRYFFNSPLHGAFEITEISMGLIVFTALPLALTRREMILVSVLFDRYPARLRRFVDGLGLFVGGVILGFMAWRLWTYGERLWTYRERTLELRVPTGLVVQTMSVLAAFAALACLVAVVALLRGQTAERRTEPVV
jgi:TRAP-type C4-dicarboxylate transport system permease small subunit